MLSIVSFSSALVASEDGLRECKIKREACSFFLLFYTPWKEINSIQARKNSAS